jgi:hypothetical protein
VGAAILGVCAAGSGVADDAADLRAALASCHAVTITKDRLACYEKLAEQSPATPTPRPAAAAAQTAPAVQATTEDFGLSPVQKAASAPVKAKPTALTAKVDGLSIAPSGRTRVSLDNGQLWEMEDAPDQLLAAGDTVTIERATMGSFLLVTAAKHAHRVRRIH